MMVILCKKIGKKQKIAQEIITEMNCKRHRFMLNWT